jgi:photosystem II stability/assembly factor-like uncharacterized protein
MLHRYPLVGRALSLLILAGYMAGLYFGWQLFLATPSATSLSNPFGGLTSIGHNSDYSQTIFMTTDAGQSWQQAYTDKSDYLDEVNCSGPANCLVMGNNFNNLNSTSSSDVTVNLVTGDAGQNWEIIRPKLTPLTTSGDEDYVNSNNLSCPAPGICYLLIKTASTGLAATQDGGKTWQIINQDISQDELNALSCVSLTSCTVVGGDGLVRHSTDSGQTWNTQKSNTDTTLFYLSCNSSQFCLALGRSGLTISSNDGGVSWLKKTAAPLKNSFKLTCAGESTCYLLGYNDSDSGYRLEVTRDKGGSWEILEDSPKTGVTGLSCPGAAVCFISTTQGSLSLTQDGGKTWSRLPVADKIRVENLSCPDLVTCFAVTSPTTR